MVAQKSGMWFTFILRNVDLTENHVNVTERKGVLGVFVVYKR